MNKEQRKRPMEERARERVGERGKGRSEFTQSFRDLLLLSLVSFCVYINIKLRAKKEKNRKKRREGERPNLDVVGGVTLTRSRNALHHWGYRGWGLLCHRKQR